MVPYAAAFMGDNTAFQSSPIPWACEKDRSSIIRFKKKNHKFLSNFYFLKNRLSLLVARVTASLKAASFKGLGLGLRFRVRA